MIIGPSLSEYTYDDPDWGAMQVHLALKMVIILALIVLDAIFLSDINGWPVSLMVGLLGSLVAVVIGTLYGAASGYIGGRTDKFMMRGLEILYAFPFMFFVIMLVTFFGHLWLVFVAIGAVSWLIWHGL